MAHESSKKHPSSQTQALADRWQANMPPTLSVKIPTPFHCVLCWAKKIKKKKKRRVCTYLVTRMLTNLGLVKSWGSTRSLIHLKMAPAVGSAEIWRPSSDWTRMSGKMKLRPRSSRISNMRSFFWSISAGQIRSELPQRQPPSQRLLQTQGMCHSRKLHKQQSVKIFVEWLCVWKHSCHVTGKTCRKDSTCSKSCAIAAVSESCCSSQSQCSHTVSAGLHNGGSHIAPIQKWRLVILYKNLGYTYLCLYNQYDYHGDETGFGREVWSCWSRFISSPNDCCLSTVARVYEAAVEILLH